MSINNNILKYLEGYSSDIDKINRLVTSTFCFLNLIEVKANKKVLNLLINQNEQEDYTAFQEFCNLFVEHNQEFTFEQLIELFEFVISPSDKIVNGAVYTPKYIREYIVKSSTRNEDNILDATACDIACGCGGFLYEFALRLNKLGKSYVNIIEENLYGVDITDYSIERTRILLSLLALKNGEDVKKINFNLFVGNSLDFDWHKNSERIKQDGGFRYIFSNPPYVGSSNLDTQTKDLMKNWQVASTGKLDLYIPFFEIGLKWLSEGGTLGYITVNNFYRSLNGRALRKYLSNNEFQFNFIDFGAEQVFKGRLTYTCICEIKKMKGDILYTASTSSQINDLKKSDFIELKYQDLDDFNGWQLDDVNVKLNLKRIENSGKKLIELFEIKNGFATLRNKIYLFKPIREDKLFYYFEKKSQIFQIEKNVCVDAVKPNILKTESDLVSLNEKLIFPYTKVDIDNNDLFINKSKQLVKPIKEVILKKTFPFAYKYLKTEKIELSNRDIRNGKEDAWFAYGRSQALNIKGKKLLFPYISDKPYFVYTNKQDLLFYNGYAIISDSEEELKFVQKILTSEIFWYYIKNTSKPYSGNYFSLAKNYVKNFSIPEFTNSEKRRFMLLKKETSVKKFLEKKYKISI
ncbi:Eco57I restriction-modification methylase domain-containing protein [Aequorivita marisscotiae]|uniref:site-specific DNA-methyltransferase (adenine-specific) n=1 Tax=Aequorivita marisscotiae TaxID=3040348 RepID=A0ABY8KUK8_9FLAO|nr:DNA methyltransferase [Aequorivita sp. Ant34-E75]WGF91537.1 TaqI-like C-terminal specificity domain-containing protein [Aequorivita sp. Ant34-E75]